MSQFHRIHNVEFIREREEDEPVVRFGDREVGLDTIDNYLFDKFQGWWQLKYPGKKAQPNDYYNFISFHADIVRNYIARHGREVM